MSINLKNGKRQNYYTGKWEQDRSFQHTFQIVSAALPSYLCIGNTKNFQPDSWGCWGTAHSADMWSVLGETGSFHKQPHPNRKFTVTLQLIWPNQNQMKPGSVEQQGLWPI